MAEIETRVNFGGFCRSDSRLRAACDKNPGIDHDVADAISKVIDGTTPEKAIAIVLSKGDLPRLALANLEVCLSTIAEGGCPINRLEE